jgi:hypothetical protein
VDDPRKLSRGSFPDRLRSNLSSPSPTSFTSIYAVAPSIRRKPPSDGAYVDLVHCCWKRQSMQQHLRGPCISCFDNTPISFVKASGSLRYGLRWVKK